MTTLPENKATWVVSTDLPDYSEQLMDLVLKPYERGMKDMQNALREYIMYLEEAYGKPGWVRTSDLLSVLGSTEKESEDETR